MIFQCSVLYVSVTVCGDSISRIDRVPIIRTVPDLIPSNPILRLFQLFDGGESQTRSIAAKPRYLKTNLNAFINDFFEGLFAQGLPLLDYQDTPSNLTRLQHPAGFTSLHSLPELWFLTLYI